MKQDNDMCTPLMRLTSWYTLHSKLWDSSWWYCSILQPDTPIIAFYKSAYRQEPSVSTLVNAILKDVDLQGSRDKDAELERKKMNKEWW